MDGEGKLKNIWISCAYSLMPYVVFMIPLTVISNALVYDEGTFYFVAVYGIYVWVAIGLINAIREVQQFTLGYCSGAVRHGLQYAFAAYKLYCNAV